MKSFSADGFRYPHEVLRLWDRLDEVVVQAKNHAELIDAVEYFTRRLKAAFEQMDALLVCAYAHQLARIYEAIGDRAFGDFRRERDGRPMPAVAAQ